jgi:hypothetical protein
MIGTWLLRRHMRKLKKIKRLFIDDFSILLAEYDVYSKKLQKKDMVFYIKFLFI